MFEEVLENLPECVVFICDKEGTLLYANKKACEIYKDFGGKAMIGKNINSFHSEATKKRVSHMLATETKAVLTVEQNGAKDLIYCSPWYDENGEYKGFVEFSFPVPMEIPNSKKD